MSIDAVVQQIGEVLGRAHALFGDPLVSGGSAARSAGSALTGAGAVVSSGLAQMSGLSGEFATDYAAFGSRAAPSLDGLAGSDQRLSNHLHDTAGADRTGRTTSASVLRGAAADTSTLAPYTATPAGQNALIAALRARLAHQQAVVAVYKARDARMAALLRSMAYPARARGPGGGIPFTGGSLGAGSGGRTGGGGPSSIDPRPHTMLASHLDRRADAPASGPGGVAAAAALSKQGTPYVWGAKGPDRFDCSGLTQWAWAQAGVRLGPDTYSQVIQGVPVEPGDVRAGDLIFPKDDFDSRGPGHVQLAISPTQVVHAPQTGDVVRIAPMPSAYVARRPVPPPAEMAWTAE